MLNANITDRNGNPIIMGEGGDIFTIRHALYMAIDAQLEEDARMDSSQKLKLAKLNLKLARDDASLTAGEIAMILDRAAKTLAIMVYSQLVLALDPKSLD